MNERFDDIIRKQLEGLESPVPPDMFDNIRNQPDVSDSTFDAGLKNKLQSVESPVAAGLFDKINTIGHKFFTATKVLLILKRRFCKRLKIDDG